MRRETAACDLLIGFEDFLAKRFEHHGNSRLNPQSGSGRDSRSKAPLTLSGGCIAPMQRCYSNPESDSAGI
jgi:hypothetical protein